MWRDDRATPRREEPRPQERSCARDHRALLRGVLRGRADPAARRVDRDDEQPCGGRGAPARRLPQGVGTVGACCRDGRADRVPLSHRDESVPQTPATSVGRDAQDREAAPRPGRACRRGDTGRSRTAARAAHPRERAAIVVTAYLGYSSEEAGRLLGIRSNTVRVLTGRARAALRATEEGST
jgi:hypothetical protein